jgi:putative hemolysin
MDVFWLEIAGVVCLIGLIGFFSASEVGVLSCRKSRLRELAEEGNRAAKTVLSFKDDPERFLATVHVGVVFSLILASGLSGMLGFVYLEPALRSLGISWITNVSGWLTLGIVAIAVGFLVVVLGELVPKSLALRRSVEVALWVAGLMRIFSIAFRGPAFILTVSSNLVLRPFKDKTTFTEARISEEEFKLMLDEGARQGVIDKTEHELIESIFEFTDTAAKEVMIPRPDVVAIDLDLPRERIFKVVLEDGYSRMPVYRGTIDNIVGIVYTKDLLGVMEYGNLIILQDVLRPAYFIPETKKISQLMHELQARRMHMAIVIDEFGGTEGIITMEDILEEIVGEIHDEYDEVLKDIEQAADGTYLVNGRTSIRDFNERFQADLPETPDYETVGGFLAKVLGRIPEMSEEVASHQFSFTIIKKSQRRVRQVRVRRTALTGMLSPGESPHDPLT